MGYFIKTLEVDEAEYSRDGEDIPQLVSQTPVHYQQVTYTLHEQSETEPIMNEHVITH